MNKALLIVILILCFCKPAFATRDTLPDDLTGLTSKIYKTPSEFKLSAGGGETSKKNNPLRHYPVIMIPGNKRSFKDWLGKNPGNAAGRTNVYREFIRAGFLPEELWLYQYTGENKEMRNIEELTDGLKWFIYSILWYTKSSKVQLLAHGEGAVLAQATIKKYNLYNIIHAVVYIAGPFHGSPHYTYAKALLGSPVCSNLAPDSDFLKDINLPDETPFNVFENKDIGTTGIKYMIIYNDLPYADEFFTDNPDSPALTGAHNHALNRLDHDGLRCAQESSKLFIPLLHDAAIQYTIVYDKDRDGFMDEEHGGPDCNDIDPVFFPGAPEIPGDSIDQDCNNRDLLPIMGKDCLAPIKKN